MGRTKNFVMGLMIAAAAISGACASMGSRSISEVQTNPGKFADKTVTVEGVVTTSWGIPLVPFKVYRVSDGSGEMLVISDDDRIPWQERPRSRPWQGRGVRPVRRSLLRTAHSGEEY